MATAQMRTIRARVGTYMRTHTRGVSEWCVCVCVVCVRVRVRLVWRACVRGVDKAHACILPVRAVCAEYGFRAYAFMLLHLWGVVV